MRVKVKINQRRRDFPEYEDNNTIAEYVKTNWDDYVVVADIDFDTNTIKRTLDVAYTWTQNECSTKGWVQEAESFEGNEVYIEGERSTSVGDIFEINGVNYVIMPFGFLEIINSEKNIRRNND